MNKQEGTKTPKPSRNAVIAALVELEYQRQTKDYELAQAHEDQLYKDYGSLLEKEVLHCVRSTSSVSSNEIGISPQRDGNVIKADWTGSFVLSDECARLYRLWCDAQNKSTQPSRCAIDKEIRNAMKGRMTGTVSDQANAMLADKNARADLMEILRSIKNGGTTLLIGEEVQP